MYGFAQEVTARFGLKGVRLLFRSHSVGVGAGLGSWSGLMLGCCFHVSGLLMLAIFLYHY